MDWMNLETAGDWAAAGATPAAASGILVVATPNPAPEDRMSQIDRMASEINALRIEVNEINRARAMTEATVAAQGGILFALSLTLRSLFEARGEGEAVAAIMKTYLDDALGRHPEGSVSAKMHKAISDPIVRALEAQSLSDLLRSGFEVIDGGLARQQDDDGDGDPPTTPDRDPR